MYLKSFGELRLEGGRLTRHTPLLLLTYLAIEGTKPRRFLADLFYPHTKNRRDNLTQALKQLREHLPSELLAADRHNVHTYISSDVAMFLDAFEKQDYNQAMTLYSGPFLADLSLSMEPELEEWVWSKREDFARKMRTALLRLAEAENLRENYQVAANFAERAFQIREVELESRELKQIYHLLKQVGHATARELTDQANEFGIDLDEPQVIREKLLIPNNLQTSATSFVGRDEELIDIAQHLENPQCRLLTLHGPGGIGKSRLALQVAHEQLSLEQFKDGIYFIPLEAATPPLVASEIAKSIKLELQGDETAITQIIRKISDKTILLILDNYEHLLNAATLPAELLRSCSNLKIIVTSREVLKLQEEWVKPISGLAYPKDKTVDSEQAITYEAIKLFSQRASQRNLDFVLDDKTLEHVIKLCILVEGSPLAIELAAAWIRGLSVEMIYREVSKNINALADTGRNTSSRHTSVLAVIQQSWRLLTSEEQKVMRQLSIYQGRFSQEAAFATTTTTLPVLMNLVDKALITLLPDGTYASHILIWKFASEKLKEDKQEYEDVRKNVIDYFYRLIGEHLPPTNSDDLMVIEGEARGLTTFRDLVLEQGDYDAMSLLPELTIFFDSQGQYEQGNEFFTKIIEMLGTHCPGKLKVELLGAEAWFLFRIGRYHKAIDSAEQALKEVEQESRSKSLHILSITHRKLRDYEQAKVFAKQGIELSRNQHDYKQLTLHIGNLALAEEESGDLEAALERQLEAIGLVRNYGSQYGLVITLVSTGIVYLKLERLYDAKRLLLQGLECAQQNHILHILPEIFENLALAELRDENFTKALFYADRALETLSNSDDLIREASLYITLGRIYLEVKNYQEARKSLVKGLETAILKGEEEYINLAIIHLGALFNYQELKGEAHFLWRFVASQPSLSYEVNLMLSNLLPQSHLGIIRFKDNLSPMTILEMLQYETLSMAMNAEN